MSEGEKRISATTYLVCLLGLLALTGLSYGCSGLDLGAMEMVVALAIACAKGSLVALFFMHLLHARGSNAFALVTAVMFVAILVALLAGDVATRPPPEAVPPAMTRTPGG